MHLKRKLGIAVLAIVLALCLQGAMAAPDGAQITAGPGTTKPFLAVTQVDAQGGNSTNLSATTETQTVAWQGFFGEVTGNITLESANGDLFYRWENITSGTVFSSRDNAVDFSSIAAQNDCTIDEDLTGTDSDRVSNAFTASSNSELTVGTTTIAANSACATNTFINDAPQSTDFEELILTDDGGTTSIYATFVENDLTGFDGNTHDFQMMVPEFRNETTSTYFFYVEIQ